MANLFGSSRPVALLLLIVLIGGTGCIGPETTTGSSTTASWDRRCDPNPTAAVSKDAFPVEALSGEPDEIAVAIAASFGDRVVQAEGPNAWLTEQGRVTVLDFEAPMWYVADDASRINGTSVLEALQKLGGKAVSLSLPASSNADDSRGIEQVWNGRAVASTRTTWGIRPSEGAYVQLGHLYYLPADATPLSDIALQSIARQAAACWLGSGSKTQDGMTPRIDALLVQDGTLSAWVTVLGPEDRVVVLDVVTGAVLDVQVPTPPACCVPNPG